MAGRDGGHIYVESVLAGAGCALGNDPVRGRSDPLLLGIDDIPRMRELMLKYRDLPMDLADAGLVRVAERERLRRIFTLDRRDFQVYRPSRIGRFAILPPR